MFNNLQVQSSLTHDLYGFTEKFLPYINNDQYSTDFDFEKSIKKILTDAYQNDSAVAQQVIQNTLFLIYQINLAHPLSIPAKKQYDPILISVKDAIEQKWLAYEFRNIDSSHDLSQYPNFGDFLAQTWKSHHASHHELFDFLEHDATKEQLFLFLKSDSALNLVFFDLVAYTLIGSQPEIRGTISENLWDEIGHGDNILTHVNLYKDVLQRLNIDLPDNHYINLYEVNALSGYNAFMIGAINRRHYYKLLGVMAMTEVLDPPQYQKLVKGCERLKLMDRDVLYYTEHITIDIKHGEDWLQKVINTIVKQYPNSRKEFYLGSLLRLQTANQYYDTLLEKMKTLR